MSPALFLWNPISLALGSFVAALIGTAFAGRRIGLAIVALGLLANALVEHSAAEPWSSLAYRDAAWIVLGALLVQLLWLLIRRDRKRTVLSAAELCSHSILLVNESRKVTFANKVAGNLFGINADQMLHKDVETFLPEWTKGTGPATAQNSAGKQFEVDMLVTTIGSSRLFLLRDIAAWRRALPPDQSDERLRLVLETIPAMVYSRTTDGRVDYANRRSTEFFGMSLAEICAGGWVEALHPDEKDEVLAKIQENFRVGEPYQMEYRRRRFDGEYRWFNTSVQPLKDATGRIVRWYGVLTDVHERRVAEASLRLSQLRLSETAQKVALSEFAASVVHELSQPLTAMVVNGQACIAWLTNETPNLNEAMVAAQRVVRDGNDARNIIAGLRNLFRKRASEMHPFSLPQTYREVISMLRGRLDKECIRISTAIPADLPSVIGERIQVQQVFLNLLNNAVDAMRDSVSPKLLIVRSALSDGYVVTDVEDRGKGIEQPDRVFEAFYSTKTEGMGMGLSICKSIVEAHNGKIWCRQAHPHGAIFSFTIPVETGEAK